MTDTRIRQAIEISKEQAQLHERGKPLGTMLLASDHLAALDVIEHLNKCLPEMYGTLIHQHGMAVRDVNAELHAALAAFADAVLGDASTHTNRAEQDASKHTEDGFAEAVLPTGNSAPADADTQAELSRGGKAIEGKGDGT